MTSNLIKGMINNLLHEQGNGFDKTIFSNLQKTNKFSPKIIRPNCLTSLFLLDVNKSPIDGFIKVRNDQEGYGDKAQKKVLLADAYNLENCFDDKNIKKNYGKKDQLLKRFIYAIENHCGGFDQKFGNSLFVQSLKNVDNAIPNENFAVQLLSGISESKIKAKDDKDIKELLKIEEACKPLVYYSLDKFVCPFKTQKEIQNRVMDYFGRTNTAANDYFRQLGIANIIKTKLADDGLINIDYNNINNKNSMIYIDITGNQSFLIDNNDPNANVEPNANITDLIKKCKLIENGSVSRNSKYIQKVLDLINKEVVKSNDSKDDKKNFLQTALTFLILMDVQDVKDPFDYVGIAIANPISDILTLMQDNQAELNRIFMNSFRTANNIVKREQGKTLNNRYFEQIQAVSIENKEELINVAQINVPNENDNVKNNNNNEENISDDANNTVSVPSNNNVSGNTTNSTPVIKNNNYIKPKDYISHNIKYYETLTSKLLKVISKDYKKFEELEGKLQEHTNAINNGIKVKKHALTPSQQEQYNRLKNLYNNLDETIKLVENLKNMHSDMVTLRRSMVKSIRNNENWAIKDNKKMEMFLTEKQNAKNAERFKIYEAYCTLVKNFDNAQKLTLANIYELKEKDPSNPLNNIFKYLPQQPATLKTKNVLSQTVQNQSQTSSTQQIDDTSSIDLEEDKEDKTASPIEKN